SGLNSGQKGLRKNCARIAEFGRYHTLIEFPFVIERKKESRLLRCLIILKMPYSIPEYPGGRVSNSLILSDLKDH
ncbi:MAG: hypothetical protein WA460_06555, partial [Nitrososphaeraceae archaeon]